MSWRTLGSVPPGQLAEARVQLHHAAQLASAVGATFLEPRPDDGHPNLGWDDALGALVGHPAQVAGGVQGGLRVAELELLWLGAAGTPKDSLRLVGRTLDEARAWLARALASAGADVPQAGLRRTGYAIPDHAVAHGAAFSATGPAHEELARWFANGHHALVELAAHVEGAADVRLWPHHFDIGGLAALRTNPDGSLAQSIGFGLSPGDESYTEPYFYVSPWPYPEESLLPRLASGGCWHVEGFTSAVLTATELLEGDRDGQGDRLRSFLWSAVEASHHALAR